MSSITGYRVKLKAAHYSQPIEHTSRLIQTLLRNEKKATPMENLTFYNDLLCLMKVIEQNKGVSDGFEYSRASRGSVVIKHG